MNPGIEAVKTLVHMGYRFRLNGESIKARHEGSGKPDPWKVAPLLEVARQHREDVRYFLKCNCPRCGGVASCSDYGGRPLCLVCDWGLLMELYLNLRVKH